MRRLSVDGRDPDDVGVGASRVERRLVLAVGLALLPIVVATTRAIAHQWLPIGDNGYLALRAADVFSRHVPLLGSGSSVSVTAGRLLNHPGPLYFDLLAVPVRFLGAGRGIAVGVALINASAVVGIVVVTRRRAGPIFAATAGVTTALLAWAMGSELLYDPWQPHAAMLPFLFFLTLVWSVTCGDLVTLPIAAFVGSLVVQTHLTYALLVPILATWAVIGLGVELRRVRRTEPNAWPSARRRAVRLGAITLIVAGLCWTQPLVEQASGDGQGNISRLIETFRGNASTPVGYRRGVRAMASVLVVPPAWLRPSIHRAWQGSLNAPAPTANLPSSGAAIGCLAALLLVLSCCAAAAFVRGDRDHGKAGLTAFVAVLAGIATTRRMPVGPFGITVHQFLWLWPLGAFVSTMVIATLLQRLSRGSLGPRLAIGTCVLAITAVALLNLPRNDQAERSDTRPGSIVAQRALDRKLGVLEHEGPLLIDGLITRLAEPHGPAVMVELQRRGISFVAKDPGLVRHLGSDRQFTRDNARAELLLRSGDYADDPPPGSHLIARHDGLSSRELRERSDLERQLSTYIRAGGLHLNARGEAALKRGELPVLEAASPTPPDPAAMFRSRELIRVVVNGMLRTTDRAQARRLDRWVELQQRWDSGTVALFLRPFS